MASTGTFMCCGVAILALLCFGHGASNTTGIKYNGFAVTNTTEYCALEPLDQYRAKYISQGFEERLYPDNKEGGKLCSCKEGANLECTMLPDIEKKPCNTVNAFYRHGSPFYLTYRGQCLCYSGEFICAKPPKGKNRLKQPAGPVSTSPPGVFLYLGYSKVDLTYLKNGRIKLGDQVPLNIHQEEWEVGDTIQYTVNYFTSNTSKTECRIFQQTHKDGNYVFKATLDEYDEYRRKKNMTDYMKWREKEECFEALESIVMKVNHRAADIRSHVVLSMFKVAHAEANVPSPPPSPSFPPHLLPSPPPRPSFPPHLLPILLAVIFLL